MLMKWLRLRAFARRILRGGGTHEPVCRQTHITRAFCCTWIVVCELHDANLRVDYYREVKSTPAAVTWLDAGRSQVSRDPIPASDRCDGSRADPVAIASATPVLVT